jgi:hexosaminidase
MSWRGTEGAIEAARQGHHSIMVPTAYFYFDYYQRKDRSHEPLAIGGYVPIEKVYSFNPLPEVLTDEEKSYIWGVQANIWTEYIHTFNHVQYMALPRMAALAEVQWCQPEQKDYSRFFGQLGHLTSLYDLYGWRWSRQAYEEPMTDE